MAAKLAVEREKVQLVAKVAVFAEVQDAVVVCGRAGVGHEEVVGQHDGGARPNGATGAGRGQADLKTGPRKRRQKIKGQMWVETNALGKIVGVGMGGTRRYLYAAGWRWPNPRSFCGRDAPNVFARG